TQDKLYYAVQLCFQRGEKISNNIAEYEGLIADLKAAEALGVKRLTIKGNSQLLVNFPLRQPREPPPMVRPQERACSWRLSLRRGAGPRN
ncbi:reverse transcriptase-like protein, partial [Shewanella sp. C31]|nr:reverse transcriptase-like protein [Shewanella electrica]